MSEWTHINGIIRFDGVVFDENSSELLHKLEGILGHTCRYDSPKEDWDACTVPCGSEGSLQYLIHEYATGLPWCVVAIWGDLRDYSNVQEITDWFNKVCKEWVCVRQGIIEIEVEGKESVVVQYKDEQKDTETYNM